MRSDCDTNGLVHGLRALRLLARNAPIDLDGFARLNALTIGEAAAVMETFEHGGYARRIPHGTLYALTPMGLQLVSGDHLIGALIDRAIGPVAALGGALGHPVTLNIRRQASMLCCVSSYHGPRPGEQSGLLECLAGLVHCACDGSGAMDEAAKRIRRQGYGVDAGALAVPIMDDGRVVAVLAVHYEGFAGDSVAAFLAAMVHTAGRLMPMRGVPGWTPLSPTPSDRVSLRLH